MTQRRHCEGARERRRANVAKVNHRPSPLIATSVAAKGQIQPFERGRELAAKRQHLHAGSKLPRVAFRDVPTKLHAVSESGPQFLVPPLHAALFSSYNVSGRPKALCLSRLVG
jgi:hypothetical protein